MKCPNCDYSILSGNICPNCGIDIVLFEKTLKISDVLYNKGLNLAKIRDLSGAVDSLTKSIQFNKNNFYARNLLGLVFYEMGKIGDALKQWVISASLMNSDNVAKKYINRIQRDPKLLDVLDGAVSMYNNALSYIQQKSDDMAIIQLKKAIELSPSFVDAMNLLTFCYLIQNERELAGVLVENVLEIDINNALALYYYNELHPNRARPNLASQPKKEAQRPVNPPLTAPIVSVAEQTRRNIFGNHFFFAEIVSFLIGGLCTLALVYFSVIPGTIAEKDAEILELSDRLTLSGNESKSQLDEKDLRISELEKTNADLEAEMAQISQTVQAQDRTARLEQAYRQYQDGNSVEAAKLLFALDPAGLDEDSLTQYNELKGDVYATAASELYNTGLSDFNNENDEDARRAFDNCLLYAPADAEYLDGVKYYLGVLAERANDIELAITYYTSVIEDHPNSSNLNQARNRLSELEGD